MIEYDDLPTSAAQRSIWFAERLAPGSARYLVPAVVELTGTLDPPALRAAVQSLVDRHEALRTGVVDMNGVPVQRIYPYATAEFTIVDVSDQADPHSAAERGIRDALAEPLPLAGPSLFRTRLFAVGPAEHWLLVLAHHLICDAWSSALLVGDLGRAYHRLRLGDPAPADPPEIQFADYAAWQQQLLTEQFVDVHMAHWRKVLTPRPEPLALPVGRARPVVRDGRGGVAAAWLPAAAANAIAAAAREANTTPYAVLLAGLAVVLARVSGQREFVFGSVVATRDQPELAGVVGCLVNTLPVRVGLAHRAGFADLLAQVREALLDAFDHRVLPFELIAQHLRLPRDPGRLPLCDVLVTMAPAAPAMLELPELTARVRRLHTDTAKADLTVEASPDIDGSLELHIEYDRAIIEPELARWLAVALPRAIAAGIAQPHRTVTTLDLSTPVERSALLALARGPAADPAPATVWQRFAATAAQAGPSVAVEGPDASLSYAELTARAHALAGRLIAAGVQPGDRVGVCTSRSSAWALGLLATLRARAAFLPLDPTVPAARLRLMLDDAAAAVVLADSAGASVLPSGPTVLRLDEALQPAGGESDLLPLPRPADLAYVIYTSGSTGQPKGVAIEHASLVRLIDAAIPMIGLGPGDRVLQFASPGFDAAVLDFALALLSGATLCLADPTELLPGPVLHRTLLTRRISYALIQPSALALLPDEPALPDLRALLTGGEAPDAALVARWGPGRRLINAYGPTEATIWATAWCYPDPPPQPGQVPPIGRPLPGVSAHVLDAELEPVPLGLPGELFLGGENLARGYLGSAALTASRFIPDPFGSAGGRLYRTGDRVLRRYDGELVYLGRLDDQVKIRGFRVEPAEAEHALRAHVDVAAAAVIVHSRRGEAMLVGYYVPRPGTASTPAALRAALATTLPAHLIPTHLVALDTLPRTDNGKLDRSALPAPAVEVTSRPPRTPLEHDVARIWQDVLELDAVGAEDNFFDLGGHSLALARVHARLVTLVGRDVPIVELFSHPTVATLASHLGASADQASAEIGRSAIAGRQRGQLRRAALVRPAAGREPR